MTKNVSALSDIKFSAFEGQLIAESQYGPVYYSDQTKMMADGPNARTVSSKLVRGESGLTSDTFTALFPFFG